jgi:hypothetical protein
MKFQDIKPGSWFYNSTIGSLMKLPYLLGLSSAIDENGNLHNIDGDCEVEAISFFTVKDLEEGDQFIIGPVATPECIVIGEKPFAIFTWLGDYAFAPDEDGFSSRRLKLKPNQKVIRVR